jgi:hypothetical protein
VGLAPQRHDDQIRGLRSVQPAPRPIGLEHPVQNTVTSATEGDQIPAGFISEALVRAVMEVVTERPFDTANEAVWFDAVPLDPVRRPTLSEHKPLLAGHVVAIGGTAMKAMR